jgi:hypothetical protein
VRRKVPGLARWLLGLGIAATLAANAGHGLGHGLIGAAVAAWPAVALVGSCELLMMIIRSARVPGTGAALRGVADCMPSSDPLQAQAARAFTAELAAVAFRRRARSASGCMSGSRAPSGYAHI